MVERDPLVGCYVHLDKKARAHEALHTLKKVASLVKPIMRARGWKVGQLAEFYPQEPSLLGLNVNRGAKICLRLRHAGDGNQFLPVDNVVDTMLHELCHNVHGPHNEQFHALWDQLRDELQGLMMKGYTGEGFLTEGRRLGGARMPDHEVRRLAREAAEKRRQHPSSAAAPGRRLGGAAPRPGQDMRRVIAEAAERRNRVLRGCAAERLSAREMREVADTATRNGFRTQADEDEANEAAIAQALWELVQEDRKAARLGDAQAAPGAAQRHDRGAGAAVPGRAASGGSRAEGGGATRASETRAWACEACTLENPPRYLCCEACGAERPAGPGGARTGPAAARIDLTQSPVDDGGPGRGAGPDRPSWWMCKACGTAMEREWWTCARCGRMKDSSR